MPVERRAVLGAVAGATTLAGCIQTGDTDRTAANDGNDGNDRNDRNSENSGNSGSSDEGDGTATTSERPTVQVDSRPDLGDILVGPDGRTLYMFDQDTRDAGESACYDSCAEAWPPLIAPGTPTAGTAVTTSVGTFERESGDAQMTANGWPLYYYVDDGAGDANGQGANDVWWVLRPDGTPNRGTAATETTTTSAGAGPY